MPLLLTSALSTIQRDSVISFPFLKLTLNPPAYFTVFGLRVYFYGVLIALGFLLGILYCARHAPDFGIKSDDFYDFILWLIPLCILGARLYYVAFRLDYHLAYPGEILAIRDGGLAIYGGIIAGCIVAAAVCKKKKIPLAALLDLTVFGLLIGQIIGRWGNFMNREAFGAVTDIFCRMGLTDPSGRTVYVHPTFLYESLWNLAGFILLTVWTRQGRRRYDGQGLLLYFFWYGLGRAGIEGLRTDSLMLGGTGIRVSQALSAALCLISCIILCVQARRRHTPDELYVNRVNAASADAAEGHKEQGE